MIGVIALDDVPPQPWRNGGGTTRELLAWPAAGDWQARISVADIVRNGPFSHYAGAERWFAVLDGAGVALRFPDRRVTLTPGGEPLCFDGAAAPIAELEGGPTRDLNLMLRRDSGHGGMLRATAGAEWRADAPLRAVFVTAAATLEVDGREAARLPGGSLAWSGNAGAQCWRLLDGAGPVLAHWLWFHAKA